MTVVVHVTGLRHHVARFEADPRVVVTACGQRVALVGGRYPGRPHDCPRCAA